MLEVFFLISTIALLFESWWVFFILQAMFWFGYKPVVGNLTSLKFSWLDEAGQRKALHYFAMMDMFANWISAGGHWDYQNVARKPRVVVEHYGRKSGKRFIAAAIPYNLADRHAAGGLTGLIIGGSNQGFENLPNWALNLRDMAAKDQCVTYSFGRTIYVAKINEVTDEDARAKLIPEMIKVYPSFANYLKEAKEHGREVPIFELSRGEPGTGEYAWQDARRKRKAEEGYTGVMRPVMSPFWEKFWNRVGI